MNYEVSVKPYLKGTENVTVVGIKMEYNSRYSFEQVELHGDHTQDSEAALIQAVLDHIRTELDPTSAIVQAQAKLQETQAKLQETQVKLEQAEQKATQTETKQNEQAEIMNLIRKVVRVMAQDSIMGEKISYGTTYKEMVELFPLAEVGKVYEPGAIFAVEDPSHVEVNGEGKRILIQTNQSFTYQGETLTQLEGTPFQNGVLTTWKFNVPKAPIGQ